AVSVSELERAQAMRAALLENPDTAPLMSEADHAELTFRTPVNEKLGFALQCRADLFHLPKKGQPRRIVDIKTTRSLGAFRHQFATLGYYRSAAFYLWVVETILGPAPTHFTYLAIEKDPPYECAAFTPDEEAIRFGLDEVDRKTMELAACLREGRFPYQFPGMQTLSLPAWYMDKKLSEDQEVSAAYVTQHSGMWTDMGDDGDEAAG
ncbi:MAG: PD-(D/E)XK nuclease-like domain-containing protein, partial [Verrucomicrobiota bacterium JB024]|nr:PD-(D/E)XK nuclease-like domain-containing protein [Verrucomicrobiota bacterium JB024]